MRSLAPLLAIAAVGCQGAAGSSSGAAQISYSPTPPLSATSNNVQAAIDDLTTKFLPLTGGTVGGLTVSGGGRLDGPLARSRFVTVYCVASSNAVCNGDPSCKGFSFTSAGAGALTGCSAACAATGSCAAYCPNGYRFAVGGGCQSPGTFPVNQCQGQGASEFTSWLGVCVAGSAVATQVICVQTR